MFEFRMIGSGVFGFRHRPEEVNPILIDSLISSLEHYSTADVNKETYKALKHCIENAQKDIYTSDQRKLARLTDAVIEAVCAFLHSCANSIKEGSLNNRYFFSYVIEIAKATQDFLENAPKPLSSRDSKSSKAVADKVEQLTNLMLEKPSSVDYIIGLAKLAKALTDNIDNGVRHKSGTLLNKHNYSHLRLLLDPNEPDGAFVGIPLDENQLSEIETLVESINKELGRRPTPNTQIESPIL